jgi:hypothetical protein
MELKYYRLINVETSVVVLVPEAVLTESRSRTISISALYAADTGVYKV